MKPRWTIGFGVGGGVGGSVGATVGTGVGGGVGTGVGGMYRTTVMRRSGTHWTYPPSASDMTRTGTSSTPLYIIGGTSSGRDSPLITASALPSVTCTDAPVFCAVTVLLFASNETEPPMSSNMLRNGTMV